MPLPNWNKTGEWDTFYLAGRPLAGVARVDVNLDSGLDVQKPKGGKKAAIRDQGTPPAEIKVELELTHAQLETLEAQVNLLRPRAVKGVREPLEASHPNLKLWGINIVTVGKISSPTPRAGGSFTVTIDMVEWVKTPKKQNKPKETKINEYDYIPLELDIEALNAERDARVTEMMARDEDGGPMFAATLSDMPLDTLSGA
jgi:hypothetical protein